MCVCVCVCVCVPLNHFSLTSLHELSQGLFALDILGYFGVALIIMDGGLHLDVDMLRYVCMYVSVCVCVCMCSTQQYTSRHICTPGTTGNTAS
jgi:hypothetical protein